jgi:hypothetical protein
VELARDRCRMQRFSRLRWVALGMTLTVLFSVLTAISLDSVRADVLKIDKNATGDGWDSNEPTLSPATIGNGSFGQTFSTPVAGQVYAQPLVVASTVIVATQHDMVYGIDSVSGAIKWTQTVGTAEPSDSIFPGYTNISPEIGVLSTPVVDSATNTVYVMARTWNGADAGSAQFLLHALDVTSGSERAGWPVTIAGSASNDPLSTFDPVVQNQRTGLLLLNGWIYAAYASFGDVGAYKGWISGVSTTTSAVNLWVDEQGSSLHAGIWQSGGGLMSDGGRRLFAVSGNGPPPPAGPASPAVTTLGQSVMRLDQQLDGTLALADYFAPFNAAQLNVNDKDLSSAPVALPDSMGVPSHPHLLVTGGKEGVVYLLDRDNLGGEAQGAGGTDASVARNAGGGGLFDHAAVWPGDGGYFYLSDNGALRAWQISNNAGTTAIQRVASGSCCFGSMSPSVTSNGTTAGSALVWTIGKNTSTGQADLQAYAAVPVGNTLPLLFHAPIGLGTKFSVPTTDNGRVFVGTLDGHLVGFGPVPRWSVVVPPSGGTSSVLNGVSAVAADDVWAVGSYDESSNKTAPLTEHRNGTSWSVVVPPRLGNSSAFNGVSAVAADDVWAVGSYTDASNTSWPLTEHRNATAWSIVFPPRGGTSSVFHGVTAVAASNVWAVGSYTDGSNTTWPLTERWKGTAWSIVVPPRLGISGTLKAVSAVAANDVWAVGFYTDGSNKTWPLTEHWNGTAWSVVTAPRGGTRSGLNAVTAISANNVWAVGSYTGASNNTWPLTEHWNGTAWSIVVPPRIGISGTLNAASAVAASDVWAVGSYTDASNNIWPLTEHWNGTAWSVVVAPRRGISSTLNAVTAVAATDVWAVGSYTDASNIVWPFSERYSQ